LNFNVKNQLGLANPSGIPSGGLGETVVSEVLGRYSTLAKAGKVFQAYAIVTAPVIFSTAAGTGGPLIWNKPNSGVEAHILAMSYALGTASTVAGSIGFTGNAGQTSAPTSTTAIDASGSTYIGGQTTQMGGVYRVGTPSVAGASYIPLVEVHTGAVTVDTTKPTWVDIGGTIIIPQGSWGAIAGNATLTTAVIGINLIWAELPA
jgi:hypothetical protein